MRKATIKDKYYNYYRRYFSADLFNKLYSELMTNHLCQPQKRIINHQVYDSKRLSCTFSSDTNDQENPLDNKKKSKPLFSYEHMASFTWKDCPLIEAIKIQLEKEFNTNLDYCLAHCYPN